MLPIAASHPAQLYFSGSLSLLALGALAVSYAAIAMLVRDRGWVVATVAALLGGIGAFCGAIVNVLVGVNLAAASTAHMTQGAAARFLVTTFNSEFEHVFSALYFLGIFVAPLLMAIALWRSRSVPRWLAVLFFVGLEVAQRNGLDRTHRRPVHAAVCSSDGPAGRPDLAGGRCAGPPEPQPGAGRWHTGVRIGTGTAWAEASASGHGRPVASPVHQVSCEDTDVAFWKPAENPRTRPLRSWAFDIGCAIVAAAASLARFSFGQTEHSGHLPLAAGLIVAVLTAGALPLRRVWPGPVFLWTLLAAAVLAQWPAHGALFPVALAISLYTVAATMRGRRRWPRRRSWPVSCFWWSLRMARGTGRSRSQMLSGSRLLSWSWACTWALAGPTSPRCAIGPVRLERERDQTSALAAAAERARIAREMHDSVAHHLTVIVALSDGALRAVTRAPAEAADAIRDVSGTARQALAETRQLLGVLRTDSGQELRQPLPGLADLDDLLGRVRAAGLPVRYERTGTARGPATWHPACRLPAHPGSPDEHDETRRPTRERSRPAAAHPGRGPRGRR